jgi:hypothetical protein
LECLFEGVASQGVGLTAEIESHSVQWRRLIYKLSPCFSVELLWI